VGRGIGIVVAFVLLLGVLIVTFAGLFGSGHDLVREFERARRLQDLDAASGSLSSLLERARSEADAVAGDALVSGLLTAADADQRASAVTTVDLGRFARSAVAVSVVRGGATLASYRSDGFPPVAGPDDIFAREHADPLLERTQGMGVGEVAAVLVRGRAGGQVLRVASPRGQESVVVVELDATAVVEGLRAAAGGGSLALLDSRGLPVGDEAGVDLADPVATTLDATSERGSVNRAELRGESVVAFVTVRGTDRAGGWRIVAKTPLSESAQGFTRDLRNKILLAAIAFGVILVIALSTARLQARQAASQEREAYLRRSLDETAQNEHFLQSLFDAITDVVVVQDSSYRIIRANRVAKKLYGEDMIGRACYQVYRGASSNAKCKGCPADKTTASREPIQVEMRDPRTDEVWQIANFPVLDERGNVKMIVEHARNVTAARRLEQQLVQSEKLSTLGEMAAGIAHEINNPIGVISMFAQLLAEDVKDASEEAREKVKTIEQHAEQVGSIVKDLLRFARKGTGERTRVDARSVVERALGIVEHHKSRGEVQVVKELPADAVWLMGEEGPLAQVVLNLALNGVQAMQGKGTLTVSVASVAGDAAPPPGTAAGEGPPATGPRVRIAVKDTGPGIPPKLMRKIFEPFFTTKPPGQGTGLGLSLSFGIVHREHQGTIWVDSAEGKGATFTIEVPAAPAP
jgi:signal transduction histidine kinase